MKTILIATFCLLTFKTIMNAQEGSFSFSANNIFIHNYLMKSEKTLAEETKIEYDEHLNVLTITTFPLVRVDSSPKTIECYQVWHINELPRSLGRKAVFLYAGSTAEECYEQFRVEWCDGQVLSIIHVTKANLEGDAAVARIYDYVSRELKN